MLEQLRGKRNREPGGHRPARYRQGALQASRGSPRAPSKPAFELFEPVQDHVDLRDGRLVAPDHDEVLTVGRNVITSEYVGGGALVVSLVEKARLRNAKSRAGRDSDHHHLIAISVENLAALRAPYALVTAVGRELPLAPSPRGGLPPHRRPPPGGAGAGATNRPPPPVNFPAPPPPSTAGKKRLAGPYRSEAKV